jgi:hypothetical protein
MIVQEKIVENLKKLPESTQAEVLDFVQFLAKKTEQASSDQENSTWPNLSLSFAMRGMEDEESPYTADDIKEYFK